MAHLLLLRSCPSFVESKESVYGQHELVERAINRRKYPLTFYREGYNRVFATEFHLMEYRVKKEVLPLFARDLCAYNLNPVNKKLVPSIFDMMFKTKKGTETSYSTGETLGRGLLWAKLFMKLISNHTTLQPVPVAEGIPVPFVPVGWKYDFLLGVLPDNDRGHGEEL